MDFDINDIRLDEVSIDDQGHEDKNPISPLVKYIHCISTMLQKLGADQTREKKRLFFRGQADAEWPVEPSVFRDNFLSIEHQIIRSAISRSPEAFPSQSSLFEHLTKLQHYGLRTRLLDVTHNPLVALFFACAPHGEYKYDENKNPIWTESDGAVYIANSNPDLPESINIQILSAIAHFDVNNMMLNSLIEELSKRNYLMSLQNTPASIEKLILPALTQNVFVTSDLNNDRIIRQSGAFLLPGCMNIELNDAIGESRITKAKNDLTSEFQYKLIIPNDDKEEILNELDFYNINEATLFPELEHQMNYITFSNKKYVRDTEYYEGVKKPEMHASAEVIDTTEFMSFKLRPIIHAEMKSDDLTDHIYQIFIDNANIDWYRKEQVQAKISSEIMRYLVSQVDISKSFGFRKAKKIVNQAVSELLKDNYTTLESDDPSEL